MYAGLPYYYIASGAGGAGFRQPDSIRNISGPIPTILRAPTILWFPYYSMAPTASKALF